MRIIFPEGNNQSIKDAAARAQSEGLCEPILLDGTPEDLTLSMQMVVDGNADAIVAGIDYTSRDVIITARDILGMKTHTFSSIFVMEMPDGRTYIVSDAATCKHPNAAQLTDIIESAAESAGKIIPEEPRIAILSFSTKGSGGKDSTIDIIHEALANIREKHPDLAIDGEMQLDAAIDPRIGEKKAPESPVAGKANVLICPDLNSGNILYKAVQQFGGAKAYGPILQGFNHPISDLSRGATTDDVYGVIKSLRLL